MLATLSAPLQHLQGETGVRAGKPPCRERKKRAGGSTICPGHSHRYTGYSRSSGAQCLASTRRSDAMAANLVPNLSTSVRRFGITHHGQGRNQVDMCIEWHWPRADEDHPPGGSGQLEHGCSVGHCRCVLDASLVTSTLWSGVAAQAGVQLISGWCRKYLLKTLSTIECNLCLPSGCM